MAYEKQTWVTGEVITKEKLNHMEDGIANGGGFLITTINTETGKLDKTWNELHNAFEAKIPVFVWMSETIGSDMFIINKVWEDGVYGVEWTNGTDTAVLTTSNPNDYPAAEQTEG